MPFALNQLGQIAPPVADVDRAEAFHEKTLGLRRYRARAAELTKRGTLMQEAPKGYAPPA